MNEYISILRKTGLFNDIEDEGLKNILACLDAEIKQVSKDEVVLLAGDKPRHAGIVLLGQLHIVRDDASGNRSLIAAVSAGEMFAEALCCAGVSESPVSVIAETAATVMLLRFSRVLRPCEQDCAPHARFIENMLRVVANKNLRLQGRMEIVCLKSIRAKVLRYLENLVPKQGRSIVVPFNREEMANYLSVERSALSHELMRMKKDGLIEYRMNRFILKTP